MYADVLPLSEYLEQRDGKFTKLTFEEISQYQSHTQLKPLEAFLYNQQQNNGLFNILTRKGVNEPHFLTRFVV